MPIKLDNQYDLTNCITTKSNLDTNTIPLAAIHNLIGRTYFPIAIKGKFISRPLADKLLEKGYTEEGVLTNGFDVLATFLTIEYFAKESRSNNIVARHVYQQFGMSGLKQAFSGQLDEVTGVTSYLKN